jgi:hypothetical protein
MQHGVRRMRFVHQGSAAADRSQGGSDMSARRSGFLVLGVIVLWAGIAAAGTPLPDPPFSNGGFVPPDALAYKNEGYVAKLMSKYATTRAKCDYTAVLGLQLAYTPANPTKVSEVQAKWTACTQKIDAYYVKTRDKLVLKGTPSCLDQAGIDAIRAQLDLQLPALGSVVYCDGEGASPDPVTGIDIPDKKQEADGEVALAKVLIKVGAYAARCLDKAAGLAFKLGGTIDAANLAKIQACIDKIHTYGMDSVAKLDQTQKLPDCLPLATAQGIVDITVSTAGQFTDDVYCASPSGAFL